LSNIDYIIIDGNDIIPTSCTPTYILSVNQNDELAGTVTFEPNQPYYEQGTLVTLRAHASSGYFFQSWSGNVTSSEPNFTFAIDKNTDVTAIFLPEGTSMEPNIIGYAAVQDDYGTPYLVTGGSLGQTVEANSVEALQEYLSSPDPYIVTVSNQIIGTEDIKVKSNKTLLGITDSAHIQGMEIEINGARNVIIQNLKISHVTPADAIVITGQSRNIWIDHCELFSDREHGQDFYDGLLDIKNQSSFITVSWCIFHDHFKTSLISSGDDSVNDIFIRVTYHHNYFYNCGSRLPSIRFGKAHIFNNYYKNCGTAINSRMGACVRVEKNFFENVGTAVMVAYSPQTGSVQLIDNHFGTSAVTTTPACELNIPYGYSDFLDDVNDLPVLITGDSPATD
jgi:pectate lyase